MAGSMHGHVDGAPRLLLRLEGFLLGCLCIWLFARAGESWWLFALLILTPDLSMLGYIASPVLGAATYNAAHSLIGPGLLAVWCLGFGPPAALTLALIWAAHIGFDRALGYGLKYPTRFADTHLGPIGRARKAE